MSKKQDEARARNFAKRRILAMQSNISSIVSKVKLTDTERSRLQCAKDHIEVALYGWDSAFKSK